MLERKSKKQSHFIFDIVQFIIWPEIRKPWDASMYALLWIWVHLSPSGEKSLQINTKFCLMTSIPRWKISILAEAISSRIIWWAKDENNIHHMRSQPDRNPNENLWQILECHVKQHSPLPLSKYQLRGNHLDAWRSSIQYCSRDLQNLCNGALNLLFTYSTF